MKLIDITESKIQNSSGWVSFEWKDRQELFDEEDNENYLPDDIKKILEFSEIKAKEIGKGFGEKLMKDFLNSSKAKSADAIFLDLNPNSGEKSNISDNEIMLKLEKFYNKFGFKNKTSLSRMWLFKKDIPLKDYPT